MDGLLQLVLMPFSEVSGIPWVPLVASKAMLVFLPIFALQVFTVAVAPVDRACRNWAYAIWARLRWLAEKLLAHMAFYVGMGIPVIGIGTVFDTPRLIGFTLTNMFIHEVLPRLISPRRFQAFFRTGATTLGLNIVADRVMLEMSIRLDKRGSIVVEESPHTKVSNFIRRTRWVPHPAGPQLEVELRRFFVTPGLNPTFFVSHAPSVDHGRHRQTLGNRLRFEFCELADGVMPLYYIENGHQKWLWRNQYWTKLFNEAGGRTYVTTPASILQKFVLVTIGTPIAFSAGGVMVHVMYGGVINLAPFLTCDYGKILALTIGGMYGASISTTIVEVGTWVSYLLRRKRRQLWGVLRSPHSRQRWLMLSSRSPYFRLRHFEAMLEVSSPIFRRVPLVAGILMGGLCSWWSMQTWGSSLDFRFHDFIEDRYFQSSRAQAAAEQIAYDYYYGYRQITAEDRANRFSPSDYYRSDPVVAKYSALRGPPPGPGMPERLPAR